MPEQKLGRERQEEHGRKDGLRLTPPPSRCKDSNLLPRQAAEEGEESR